MRRIGFILSQIFKLRSAVSDEVGMEKASKEGEEGKLPATLKKLREKDHTDQVLLETAKESHLSDITLDLLADAFLVIHAYGMIAWDVDIGIQ